MFDQQGKEDGFYLLKKKYILSMKRNADYLKKMALYREYWGKNRIARKTKSTFNYSSPVFLELFDYAENAEEIVTISTDLNEEVLITGYVKSRNEDEVQIECIDIETAMPYEIISIPINDIVYFEIESVDNMLIGFSRIRLAKYSI